MDKQTFLEILGKYNKGKATLAEVDLLEAYYDLFEVENAVLDDLTESQKQGIKQEIALSIQDKMHKTSIVKSKWFAVAAMLLVIFSVGILMFRNEEVPKKIDSKVKDNVAVIEPGSNQAILTLSDGSTIGLNDKNSGVIVDKADFKVTKNKAGQVVYQSKGQSVAALNTITTPRGGQYQLMLEDGTRVWLNAESSIRFPTHFTKADRTVVITGEVYFEVAKNKQRPFIVRTRNQQIEVLGTHFNVNTYADELSEKTTLIEGSVKVVRLNKNEGEHGSAKILSPGQVASLSDQTVSITVGYADTEAAISWKNGYFKLDKTDIESLMRQVSRWYNVEVKYVGKIHSDLFAGKIKRSENISDLLRILQLSKINATLEGRTIIITN